MKFSLSFPQNGTTKTVQVQNANSWRHFLEKRMGQEVEADSLGDQFKGYVFKVTGGFDKDGFAMKQGIMCNGRVRLLLKPGAQGYRARRTGERKRKSVRGCIVGPDITMLSCIVVKKGEKDILGLTNEVKPRRLGPKRASGIRKLFGISKGEGDKSGGNIAALIKKNVIRRTFRSKKTPEAHQRQKAPKIQRLITDVRIRRKRIQKLSKIKRWKKTLAATEEYKKLYEQWTAKKRVISAQAKQARKDSASVKKSDQKNQSKQKKPVQSKDKKTTEVPKVPKVPKKTEGTKKAAPSKKPQVPKTTETKPATTQPAKKK